MNFTLMTTLSPAWPSGRLLSSRFDEMMRRVTKQRELKRVATA